MINEPSHTETTSATTPTEPAATSTGNAAWSAERCLEGFTDAERQRLRFLRRRFELGKLTEFPQRTGA